MTRSNTQSRLKLNFDLTLPGRQVGDLMLRWSDNTNPLGYNPIPVISIKGGYGPIVLILGGTHGDEFEGPSAIMRLACQLKPGNISGQVILMPAFNAPAVAASSRVSPLDGVNINRAFPGDSDGGPTEMLAHFLETKILSQCDAVVDLHSGGKASFFQPCALATQAADPGLREKNIELAEVFGLPLIWMLGVNNDNRSVNSAAERAGVPMIAIELGGGGGVDPDITDLAEEGLLRVLRHLGLIDGAVEPWPTPRKVEIAASEHTLYAPAMGIYDRAISAGQDVKAGDFAGWFHFVTEPVRPSIRLECPHDGFVLAHTNRGMVQRGEMLALVAQNLGVPTK